MIQVVVGVFGGVLILSGVAGFVVHPRRPLTSSAPPYNLFHIGFGLLGIAMAVAGPGPARGWAIGFGLIDLYQAVASAKGWFPIEQFRWRRGDDVLHVVIGFGLLIVGVMG